MRLSSCFGLAAAGIVALVGSSAFATTYTGAHAIGSNGYVDLSITTDGLVGPLDTSDILSFNILISDNTGSIDLTNLNSGVLVEGSDLVATPTTLSFVFSPTLDGSGFALFEYGTIGDSGPSYCVTNGGCYGESTPVEELNVQGPFSRTTYSGPVVIATSGVPEAKSWALLLVGFASLGAAVRSVRRAPFNA